MLGGMIWVRQILPRVDPRVGQLVGPVMVVEMVEMVGMEAVDVAVVVVAEIKTKTK
jgi:hypothetical protein